MGRYRREEDKSDRGGSGLTHCWSFRPRRTLHQHSLEGEAEGKKKSGIICEIVRKLRRGRNLEPSRVGKRVPTHLSFKSGARNRGAFLTCHFAAAPEREKSMWERRRARVKVRGRFTKREINQAISTLTDAPGCCRAAGQRGWRASQRTAAGHSLGRAGPVWVWRAKKQQRL